MKARLDKKVGISIEVKAENKEELKEAVKDLIDKADKDEKIIIKL